MADLKKIAEDISKLSLVDAVELKNILKDEYGIEPAAGGAAELEGASAPASGWPLRACSVLQRCSRCRRRLQLQGPTVSGTSDRCGHPVE